MNGEQQLAASGIQLVEGKPELKIDNIEEDKIFFGNTTLKDILDRITELEEEIKKKAPMNHSHSQYALRDHTHSSTE